MFLLFLYSILDNDIVIGILWGNLQVARILMKTLSQLTSGKQPVGTMAYMGNVQYLMQCKCAVNTGTYLGWIIIFSSSQLYLIFVPGFLRIMSVLTMVYFMFGDSTAEDWLNPVAIQEAFEARALRMAVNCAQNIGQAANQEEGSIYYKQSIPFFFLFFHIVVAELELLY
jgi:acyl-CoA oxidase